MAQVLDLDTVIAEYIDENADLPVELVIGQPSTHGTSFAYLMRSLQKYTNYRDGRQRRTFSFDIQAKCPSWLEATNTLNRIADLMNKVRSSQLKSQNGSFEFSKASMKQPPSFIANVTDNLDVVTGEKVSGNNVFCVYDVSFEVEAIINR